MGTGRARGEWRPSRPSSLWGIDLFLDEEGGSTTVTVAVSLLASLALVFALAQVAWVGSRAGDVQAVADSAALSAMAPVKAFRTVAQVADATVLSLGLTGLMMVGAGAVTALVPGLGPAGLRVVDAGRSVLDSRRTFAQSASEGLQRLEKAVPAAMATQSWSVVQANSAGAVSYNGLAIPYPATGSSSYGLADDVQASVDSLSQATEEMAAASDAAKAGHDAADAALEKGWRADCVDDPSCARSRASRLAGLSGSANPGCPHKEGWSFGMALRRARAYYTARAASEAPTSSSTEERARSALRSAYYAYALRALNQGWVTESGNRVSVSLPELAHNADTTRASTLYTESRWPCTEEEGGRTAHAFSGCPGATGASSGVASVADVESGTCRRCEVCGLDLASLGAVASASYNIDNGFEHYWAQIVAASREWEPAENAARAAEERSRAAAEQGASLFDRALAALAVPRPSLKPPGHLGAVALVARPGNQANGSLVSAFSGEASLPAGCAIAGACLAAEDATGQENVLARFFDSMSQGEEVGVAGVLQGVVGLWGELLVGYGGAYGSVSDAAARLLDGLDAVGASSVATWLKDKVGSLVAAAGFEPADLRLRKPVLCNTQDILSADGSSTAADLRRYLQAMPADGTPAELLAAFGRTVRDDLGEQELTIAELTVPGTSISVPFKVKVKTLWGGS